MTERGDELTTATADRTGGRAQGSAPRAAITTRRHPNASATPDRASDRCVERGTSSARIGSRCDDTGPSGTAVVTDGGRVRSTSQSTPNRTGRSLASPDAVTNGDLVTLPGVGIAAAGLALEGGRLGAVLAVGLLVAWYVTAPVATVTLGAFFAVTVGPDPYVGVAIAGGLTVALLAPALRWPRSTYWLTALIWSVVVAGTITAFALDQATDAAIAAGLLLFLGATGYVCHRYELITRPTFDAQAAAESDTEVTDGE